MFKDAYISGHPLSGQGLRFRKDPLEFFEYISQQNQGFQRFRFAWLPMVNLSHPDLVKHVMQTNNRNYVKGIEYDQLRPVLGNGLLTNEGDSWFKQRRLAQPAFHKKRIAGFLERMEISTEESIGRLKKQEAADIHAEMMRLTLEIVSRTMFGTTVDEDADKVGHAMEIAIDQAYKRIERLVNLPLWVPVGEHRRYNRSIKDLNTVVHSIINSRLDHQSDGDDLLDMLMQAEDEDTGEKMSAEQLKDEVMTIFLAGHETTANALSWTYYLLSEFPEERNKLMEELKASNWSYQTPYLTMVINESLRLFPPAWGIGRTALETDEFQGVRIKKNHNVTICAYTIHRDPEFWADPEEFRPGRFENPKDYDKFVFFPFGGGPRFCIGNNFAMLEMQVVLTMMLKALQIDVVGKVEPEPLVTLRPKGGMNVKVTQLATG